MERKKSATMKDIAEKTGFSINTVARALKDRDDVAPASKARIQQVAAELNYINNSAATYLRTGQSGTIAVILADITNPTFSEGVREIEQIASRDRYALMLFNTNEDAKAERQAIQTAISKNADGILICPCGDCEENLRFLHETGIPFVLLGRKSNPAYPWVVRDDRCCGAMAAAHLIKAGRRRVLMINGSHHISSARERTQGFLQELEKAGIVHDPALSAQTGAKFGEVGGILDDLAQKDVAFDSIFAFSDILAMEAVCHLRSKGIRVPEDVAVVGVDNLCRTFPYLTPVDSLGETGQSLYCISYNKLVGMLKKTDQTPNHIVLEVALHCHGSV